MTKERLLHSGSIATRETGHLDTLGVTSPELVAGRDCDGLHYDLSPLAVDRSLGGLDTAGGSGVGLRCVTNPPLETEPLGGCVIRLGRYPGKARTFSSEVVTMSANGEAPFFSAPELTQRDGTLSEAPGEMFADPVSGLVTTDPEPRTAMANGHAPAAVPVAGPVQPDEEVVRRMVEETLREDGVTGSQAPEAIPPAGTTSTLGENAAPPLGVLPRQRNRQRTWPTRPPQLLRPRQASPEEDFDEDLEVVPVKRRKLPKLPSVAMPAFGRPSSSAAGVMLAVALLIVFGFVAIEMVSSLVSSVTGLFD
jgi:hypothetical protein